MKIKFVFALSLLSIACCQANEPSHSAESFYQLVDLTDDFAAFFDRSGDLPLAQRISAMQTQFSTLIPGFYDFKRVASFATAEQYEQLYNQSFTQFPQQRSKILQTATHFESMLKPALVNFKAQFPDVAPLGTIYLLHSLGEMDGGTRTINDKTVFVFGADVMSKIYPLGQEQTFFHHEIFHMYHRQFFNDCDQVWCYLWSEGLAVYVSHALNPKADDLQLGLTMPRAIRPEVDANLKKAICAVTERFNSTETSDYGLLFRGKASPEGLPPRFGYYIGYKLAGEIAKKHSLQSMAHMSIAEVKPALENALRAFPACP